MEEIIKIGNVELYAHEVAEIYEQHKYIVTYSKVYTIDFHDARTYPPMYSGRVIHTKPTRGGVGYVRRGRFITATAEQVNKLIGFNLLTTAL